MTTETELTTEEEIRRGKLIAEVMQLKKSKDYSDRYFTSWGTKSAAGVYYTVKRLLEEGK